MTPPLSNLTAHESTLANDTLTKLRGRIGTAASGLHETLQEVMAAFDRHENELASLRQSLAQIESKLASQAPQMAAIIQPKSGLEHVQSLPASVEPAPPAAKPQRSTAATMPMPAIMQPGMNPMAQQPAPLMTQVLWPSITPASAAPAAEPAPVSAPTPTPAPVKTKSCPISLVESMLNSTPVPAQSAPPPTPVFHRPTAPMSRPMTSQLPPSQPLASPVSSASVMMPSPPPADHGSPTLEQATLEELNAALAYAFSQVSNSKPMGSGGITQMMPAPLPTQAMRFGMSQDYVDTKQ